jgi:hypothetical protein
MKVSIMQVFLSYAEQDESVARRVAAGLEKENLKVWDDRKILPGTNWADEIAKALKESKAMIVLLTPASLRSQRVRREIEYALGDETYSHRLVPVIVGPPEKLPKKDIPWILHSLKIVNLPERGNPDKEIKEIANALKAA